MDLSGNVWEWCQNEYGDSGRESKKMASRRVLRGGSWDNEQDFARAKSRSAHGPDSRNHYLGFRVVCVSPIP